MKKNIYLNQAGNNLGCVAVGDGGTIIFSVFGTSWATATSGTTNELILEVSTVMNISDIIRGLYGN